MNGCVRMKACAGALVLLASTAQAATVRVVEVPSASMKTNVTCSIILPDGYEARGARRYPAVYMLHGAGNSHTSFADEVGMAGCDKWNFIGVCPDGAVSSWWFDSPVDPKFRYETFVSKELVQWIDRNFATEARKEKRAITGGSMGGHGACWLGFRHRDVFGAIGNIHGGVDFRPFKWKWDIGDRLGWYDKNHELWLKHCCVYEAQKLRNGDVNLISIVGTADFFLNCNRQMHEILLANEVEHIYIEIRGKDEAYSSHTNEFRRQAEPTVFYYFSNYFTDGKGHL